MTSLMVMLSGGYRVNWLAEMCILRFYPDNPGWHLNGLLLIAVDSAGGISTHYRYEQIGRLRYIIDASVQGRKVAVSAKGEQEEGGHKVCRCSPRNR